MDRNILQGKRIAITAVDLVQQEHRGLAVMAKSLIELLNKYGAEVYLITSITSFRLNRINKYVIKKRLKDEIFIADICAGLEKGFNYRKKFNQDITYKFKLMFNLFFNIAILHLKNFNLKNYIFILKQIHRDINIFSRARQINIEDFEKFNYILAMDDSNFRNIQDLKNRTSTTDFASIKKIQNFRSFFNEQEVPDPYFGGDEGFDHVLDILEDSVSCFLESIS